MTGVAAEMVFSVFATGHDDWPGVGVLGTGSPPAAVPIDHGSALVVAGDVPAPASAVVVPPMVFLRGHATHGPRVSATLR